MSERKTICLFCGAQDTMEEKYKIHAYKIGEEIASRNMRMLYGGSKGGVMRSVALGCAEAGGEVVAIYPTFFEFKHVFENEVSKVIDVKTLAERKEVMIEMSDIFLTLPGGFGTLDEIFEVLTMYSLHNNFKKRIIFYNQENYWDGLKATIENAINCGFVKKIDSSLFQFVNSMEKAFEIIDLCNSEAEKHAAT